MARRDSGEAQAYGCLVQFFMFVFGGVFALLYNIFRYRPKPYTPGALDNPAEGRFSNPQRRRIALFLIGGMGDHPASNCHEFAEVK